MAALRPGVSNGRPNADTALAPMKTAGVILFPAVNDLRCRLKKITTTDEGRFRSPSNWSSRTTTS